MTGTACRCMAVGTFRTTTTFTSRYWWPGRWSQIKSGLLRFGVTLFFLAALFFIVTPHVLVLTYFHRPDKHHEKYQAEEHHAGYQTVNYIHGVPLLLLE